ncbi:MAG: hypothetical protein COV91_03235 [Candidatus Taylorbacteria bacterium CG11_big_fil_rev_8_21_14_0_20_46_11]|uniref:SHS2 domain-containing protein n=1 Tax=Candidatus Taylorbacteria bacterium CG11_big_fil_rev_8_21_14_0_20_46_11 TaxID=1975025 RepID=A0A2H0KBG0_9BACT|nr:MAG: hypothetical protein COV91_03235 [Candidatus Taylorbacteria bacterium CG11_big_fil_rev_8_21_14_0_20_46_11]
MGFLTANIDAKEILIILDIGSGSVGGAIVLSSHHKPPTILYSTRSEILFRHEVQGSRLLSLMLRALSEVMLAITHEGFEKSGLTNKRSPISEVFVSLSAPWTISKTTFLHFKNAKPTRITESVFETLLEEAGKTQDQSKLPKGSVEIEKKLVQSILNGYETDTPFGKEAREAEFTVLSSFSLPKITEKISDIVTHLLHVKHLSFHSFSLLSFATIRDIFPTQDAFIFMDVSGEQTEVSVVKKNVLVETITFPYGKNQLIRMLSTDAQTPSGSAESFIRLYHDKKGKGKLYDRAVEVCSAFKSDWLTHFLKSLATFSEELFLPRTLYLTADTVILPLIKDAIAEGDFTKFTLASVPFETTIINENLLTPYVHVNPSLVVDPFLILEAIFASHLRSGRIHT